MPAINKPLYTRNEEESQEFYIGYVSYEVPPYGEEYRAIIVNDLNPSYSPIPLNGLEVCLETMSLTNDGLPIVGNNYRGWYSVNSTDMVHFFRCPSASHTVPTGEEIYEVRRVFIVPYGYSVSSNDFYMYNQLGANWMQQHYDINEVFPQNTSGMDGRFFEIVTTVDVDSYIAVKITKDEQL